MTLGVPSRKSTKLPKQKTSTDIDKPSAALASKADSDVVDAHRWRHRRLIAVILIGWLIHVAWRLWLSRPLYTPVVHGDEDRYLVFARVLAGGPGGGGGDTEATRRAGYALLITPVYWFTSEPFTVYRAVQVLNALINALTFPLAYLFARRILDLSSRWALGVGFVAAAMPAVVYFAPFALPNAVMTPLLLGWLLALHTWMTSRTGSRKLWAAAIIAGALIGFMYVVHVRALLLLPMHALIGVCLLLMRRTHWSAALASATAASLVMVLHPLLKAALAGKMHTGGVEPENRMIEAFTTVDGLLRTLSDAAGQIWYLTAATWGLAALGLVFAGYWIVKHFRTRWPEAAILATSMVSTVLIAVVTAAALPDDGKLNNHVYPGYIIFLAPIWMMVAIVALRATATHILGASAGAAVLVLATWFVVESYVRPRPRGVFFPIDAPEPSFLANDWSKLRLALVTVITLLFLLAWVTAGMAGRKFGLLLPVALAGVGIVNAAAVHSANSMMRELAKAEYSTGPRLVQDAGIRPGETVVSAVTTVVAANHQREVYWTEIGRFDPRVQEQPPPGVAVVIAPFNTGWGADWDGSRYGWQRIGADPVRGWVAWRRPA